MIATGLAVVALLVAERRAWRPGVWIAKPLAATGFLATALAAGALESDYGRLVLGALVLCWLGDVLLIPKGARGSFIAGLVSFLAGHLVYAWAFASRGIDPTAVAFTALLACIPAGLALRWLRPHLPDGMRIPVYAYIAVISAMFVTAVCTGLPQIILGAGMFFVSDLAVARERFVASSFTNKLWGLPLYFGAQLVLAASIAAI